jgi:hypothetical protein
MLREIEGAGSSRNRVVSGRTHQNVLWKTKGQWLPAGFAGSVQGNRYATSYLGIA